MKLTIDLLPAHAAQLAAEAKRLGVPAEELARAAVTDLLALLVITAPFRRP